MNGEIISLETAKHIADLEKENSECKSIISKINNIVGKLCVMKPWENPNNEMTKLYRPIKNTKKQEVYKAISDIDDILKGVDNSDFR